LLVGLRRLRVVYREKQEVNAEVVGRLGEALAGIRVVKAYVAEPQEDAAFTRGAERLFANFKRSTADISALSVVTTVTAGLVGATIIALGFRAVYPAR
jgi:ABC-type multidrug transport system fused ATPase/permease subunit